MANKTVYYHYVGIAEGESNILADLAMLRNASRQAEIEGEEASGDQPLAWQQPKGQTGDGRTALNDKLGY